MKKAAETEKKKAEKENKAQKKANKKSQTMDIRRLIISNSQKVVWASKKLLSDRPIGLEASNDTVPDFLRPETSNNAVPDLLRSDSSSSTPKSLFSASVKFSNSQKKKTT